MYDHKPDQKKSLKAEFEDLKKRFDEVMKVTSKQDEIIKFLQYKVDMMGKQMIGAVREMSEHIEYIEDVTREDGKVEKMDIEHTKSRRKENLDDSYDIYSDAQFKEIMEKQRGIASSLENNLKVIQTSLKKKKVQETVASLKELHGIVQNDEKELKEMLGKDIKYLEFYKDEQEAVPSQAKPGQVGIFGSGWVASHRVLSRRVGSDRVGSAPVGSVGSGRVSLVTGPVQSDPVQSGLVQSGPVRSGRFQSGPVQSSLVWMLIGYSQDVPEMFNVFLMFHGCCSAI